VLAEWASVLLQIAEAMAGVLAAVAEVAGRVIVALWA